MQEKKEYKVPELIVLGSLEDLTGEGGANSDDGWGYSAMC